MSDPFQSIKPIEKVKSDNEKLKFEGEKAAKEIEKVKADNEKPVKEKLEKREKAEIKEVKLELKENKFEVKEHKGDKEKVEVKENKLEVKEFKLEKLEREDFTLEPGKPPVKEAEGPSVPEELRVSPAIDRDVLLRHAEALEAMGRELRHFIERGDRPDLSRGALRDEPDQDPDDPAGDR
jgi:hypothetical protein